MLDCRRVEPFRLRFSHHQVPDLVLGTGVHGIGLVGDGVLAPVRASDPVLLQVCVDRRGVWLKLAPQAQGVHVNGRPVRQMAMLRVGDAIYLDGTELLLLAPPRAVDAIPPAGAAAPAGEDDPRILLRGVGGHYHGRSFTLDRPRLVGRGADCDIRIDDPACAERHARIELHGEAHDHCIVLRDLTGGEGGSVVNGEPVHDAWLQSGDQIVFDAHQRFVVEAPGRPAGQPRSGARDAANDQEADDRVASPPQASRRLPWLLLAALLIAAALSALLLFGASN
jgi:pSer/pThr/pTyr-binding forkhead associated (FHA) protein